MKPMRPWRVTVAGAVCIGTYATVDHARAGAVGFLNAGLAPECWIRRRDSDEWETITNAELGATRVGR
jgi:hypothetical protein